MYSKGKGRASLQKPVAACVLVTPEYRATRGRIVRHRPRLNHWSVTIDIEFDDVLLTEQQLRMVVDDSGTRVGLLRTRGNPRSRSVRAPAG